MGSGEGSCGGVPMGSGIDVDMPGTSTVADLQVKVRQVFSGYFRLQVANGGALLDDEAARLMDIPGLQDVAEVQVLPAASPEASIGAQIVLERHQDTSVAPTPSLLPSNALQPAELRGPSVVPSLAPAPSQSRHDPGCHCMKCIKRRQFG